MTKNELKDIEYTLNKVRQELHIANLLKIIELFEIKEENYKQATAFADDIYEQMTVILMQYGGF